MENTQSRKTVTINLNIKKFMPNILWVLKARSTDKNRYQLNCLNIDDTGYCCTDGKRLHLCKDKSNLPFGIENGLYNVIVAKDLIIFNPEDGNFPDYKNIIPVGLENKMDIDLYNKKDNHEFSAALIKIFKTFNTAINII